jgi:hypothetical protein
LFPSHDPGGCGGVFNAVNGFDYYLSESTFNNRGELTGGTKPYPPGPYTPTPFVSQSWRETILTTSGSVEVTRNTQQEFYNGELGGSEVLVTNGEINPVLVTETYIPDSEFVAAYNTVTNRYSLPPSAVDGAASYSVVNGYYFQQFSFSSRDTSGTNRASYLSSLSVGDTFNVRTRLGSTTANYTFTITGISTYGGAYVFYVPPTSLVGQFYVDRNNINTTLSWDMDLIWDPQTGQVEANSDSISPILNNVDQIRQSAVFMDVDYTSFGSGSLRPVNIQQIIDGEATLAPVQDSNYTSIGFANARYNGTKVSSLGFNIPYSKT